MHLYIQIQIKTDVLSPFIINGNFIFNFHNVSKFTAGNVRGYISYQIKTKVKFRRRSHNEVSPNAYIRGI